MKYSTTIALLVSNTSASQARNWGSTRVTCTPENARGIFKCLDSDGWNRQCHKSAAGVTKCKDSDGRMEFCRINRRTGFMTCSDRDHPAWWNRDSQVWNDTAVTCAKNAAGALICVGDADGYERTCYKDDQGRTRCRDYSDGVDEFCRLRNGRMTCTDRDIPSWWRQDTVPAVNL